MSLGTEIAIMVFFVIPAVVLFGYVWHNRSEKHVRQAGWQHGWGDAERQQRGLPPAERPAAYSRTWVAGYHDGWTAYNARTAQPA